MKLTNVFRIANSKEFYIMMMKLEISNEVYMYIDKPFNLKFKQTKFSLTQIAWNRHLELKEQI